MEQNNVVDVFPINREVFGFEPNWLANYASKLIEPSYLLMVLLLIIYVGILALKRFEGSDLEKKIWNIPVIVIAVAFWPSLVLGLKELVDHFNTFLVFNVFQIPWERFGFRSMGPISGFFGWSVDVIAQLLPILAYWIIYTFYILFVFLYAGLGPFIIAKGILTDEVENFLELLLELLILFLWQTMVVILVAFILPDMVSGGDLRDPDNNVFFLSFILGVMLFFVPTMTRKFVVQLSHSFFPPGTGLGIALLGTAALTKGVGLGFASIAKRPEPSLLWRGRKLVHGAQNIRDHWSDRHQTQSLEQERAKSEKRVRSLQESIQTRLEAEENSSEERDEEDKLLNLVKRAKSDFDSSSGI